MPRITVYTLPICQQCNMTKRKLAELGLDFDVADLSAPESAQALAAFKSRGLSSAPIVVVDYGNGETPAEWSGYRPDLLQQVAA